MMAMGTNEIQWAERYARPHMNYFRNGGAPELPQEYLALLKRYLSLVPHLASSLPRELQSKTLSQHDLHLDNIFVDPDTKIITHIIDWQSTAVSELFLQYEVPRMLPLADRGDDGRQDTLSGISGLVNHPSQETDVLTHYQDLTRTRNPSRWASMNFPYNSTLTNPTSLVSGTWTREDLFSFRHALITVAAQWAEISPGSVSCPIKFTREELEAHNEEMELLEDLSTVLHALEDGNLISVGGRVLR
jgi:hypothetical protein